MNDTQGCLCLLRLIEDEGSDSTFSAAACAIFRGLNYYPKVFRTEESYSPMATKYFQGFPIPDAFPEILHDFAREVLRDQPEDIIAYGAYYFECLEKGTEFSYDSKYNVKRQDKRVNKSYIYSQDSTLNQTNITRPESGRSKKSNRSEHAEGERVGTGTTHKTEKKHAKSYMDELITNINYENVDRPQTSTTHKTEKGVVKTYMEELMNNSLEIMERQNSHASSHPEEKYATREYLSELLNESMEKASKEKKGTLLVNIVSATNLRKNVYSGNLNPYVTIEFEPDIVQKKYQTPSLKGTQNPVWNYKTQIQLDFSDLSVMDVEMRVDVIDMNPIAKSTVGELVISLVSLLDRPGKWLNEFFPLTLEDPNNHSIICGNLYMQLCWVPIRLNLSSIEEPQDLRANPMINQKVIRKSIAPSESDGVLQVKIMAAGGIDQIKSASIKVALEGLHKPFEKTTKSLPGQAKTTFNEQLDFEFPMKEVLNKEEQVSAVCSIQSEDSSVANLNVNLREVFLDDGKWKVNQYFKMGSGNQYSLYLQVRWLIKGIEYPEAMSAENIDDDESTIIRSKFDEN